MWWRPSEGSRMFGRVDDYLGHGPLITSDMVSCRYILRAGSCVVLAQGETMLVSELHNHENLKVSLNYGYCSDLFCHFSSIKVYLYGSLFVLHNLFDYRPTDNRRCRLSAAIFRPPNLSKGSIYLYTNSIPIIGVSDVRRDFLAP